MKTLFLISLFWVFVEAEGAVRPVNANDDSLPELRGVLADGSGQQFGLLIPDSLQTGWAKVGQVVGGWRLREYRAADNALVLVKGDREYVIRLSQSVIGGYRPGTQGGAMALLKAMSFEERMDKAGFEQNLEQMLKQLLMGNGLYNPTSEQLEAFKKMAADTFTLEKFSAQMGAAMGEVYTQEELKAQADFYASEAGQGVLDAVGPQGRTSGSEPPALSQFYATPLGQAVKAKQKTLDDKEAQIVAPWVNDAMQSLQKAASAFAKAQGAAPPSGAAEATP